MKYRVVVPPPSAKRMAANGKIIISLSDGWTGDELIQRGLPTQIESSIPTNSTTFEFEVPDQYAWVNSNNVIDGWSFRVLAEYKNSTGTRLETKELVPEKI